MSYNIDTFKVKSVTLILPKDLNMSQFAKENNVDHYDQEIEIKTDGSWSYNEGGEGLSMNGRVTEKGLEVDDLYNSGEGSGWDDDLMRMLFEKFKGDLVASRVWEGGDSIDRITIKKGDIKVKEIDL